MARKYISKRVYITVNGRRIKLIILRPLVTLPREKTAGVLWIHGGGYVTGMAEMVFMSRARALVEKYGAVVVAPDYTLAGRLPYPAALEDCVAALEYLNGHVDTFGVNPERIMVGGESAGGGLTAAVCMAARDRGDIHVAFQMPLYPMLDDRDTPSSAHNYRLPWNTFFNHLSWKKYISGITGKPSSYAVPARQTDYANLPPCYTFVGDREPFYCETLEYVENLRKAGVPAHVDVYPTGFHAFDMLTPFRKISRAATAEFEARFMNALEGNYSNE